MSASRFVRAAAVLVALAACTSRPHPESSEPRAPASGDAASQSASPSVECRAALDLGERVFRDLDVRAEDYRLVRAENVLGRTPPCAASGCWRLTYKMRSLIPTSSSGLIGLGGEIFVEVNLVAATARVAGYGE